MTNTTLIKNTKELFDKTNSYKNLLIEKNETINSIQKLKLDKYNSILELISCYNDKSLLNVKKNLINFDKLIQSCTNELNNTSKLISDLDTEIDSLKICSIDNKKYKLILINKRKNLLVKRDNLSISIKKLDYEKNKIINDIYFSIAINYSNQKKKPMSSRINVFKIEGIIRNLCNIRNKIDTLNKKANRIDSQINKKSSCIDILEKEIILLYGNSCSNNWVWTHHDFE